MSSILDFHTHAYPKKVAGKAVQFLNNYYHIQCQGTGTIDDLKRSAADAHVDYLLVHSVATKPEQVENVNTWIAAHLSEHIIGFGSIHPGYRHAEREIARIKALGLKGIKLHPDFQEFNADCLEMDKVYSLIEGKMPVLFHTGDRERDYSSPRRVAHIVEKYPNLTVIAAHLGGYTQWDAAREYLIGKNLYIDTSSSLWFLSPEEAASIIRAHGVEKVLFGTDYPLSRHKEELARFNRLPLSDRERGLILFENAKRILKL